MTRIDEGPREEGWERLGLFLSRDIIERRYAERHRLGISAGKAAEIIAHLEQGRQYFRSAETAGALAGPLEQYYGVLAFARAIILFREPGAREATLKKSHGLDADLSPNGKVEDITLSVCGGTFDELLEATGNPRHALVTSYAGKRFPRNFTVTRRLPRPPAGTRLSVMDLLSRIPELREAFEEAVQQRAHNYLGVASCWDTSLSVNVWAGPHGLPSPDELQTALGIASVYSASVTPNGSIQFALNFAADAVPPPTVLPNCVAAITGGTHIVIEPFMGGWSLSDLSAYFAVSHVMSMLVRYYPTLWAKLIAHERGDRLLPVFERARSLLQTEFVRLVLWELERVDTAPQVDRDPGG